MFIRCFPHWAAHLFIASIALHVMRVFFTGVYRNPREINWVVGTLLVLLDEGAEEAACAFEGAAAFVDDITGCDERLIGLLVDEVEDGSVLVLAGEMPAAGALGRHGTSMGDFRRPV